MHVWHTSCSIYYQSGHCGHFGHIPNLKCVCNPLCYNFSWLLHLWLKNKGTKNDRRLYLSVSLFVFYTFSIREWHIDFQALLDVHFCKWPALINKLRWRMAQTRDLMKLNIKVHHLMWLREHKGCRKAAGPLQSTIICLSYRIQLDVLLNAC